MLMCIMPRAASLVFSCSPCLISAAVLQGAVAVEGEAHIWRPGRKGSSSAPDAEGSDAVAPAEKDSFAAANGVLEPASEVAKAVEHEIAAQKDIAAQGEQCRACPWRT